ncbi:MAG: carboxypeptidase regulatory-like domain-containing protein [Candidatus Aminicenantes bacterium]
MKKLVGVLCVLLLTFPLAAQQRTGNIYGNVVDEDGNPLPGVEVTLTGSLTAATTAITNQEGNFRFLSLAPGRDYVIVVELEGFRTATRERITVNVGANTEMTIQMRMGTVEEEVTVTATTPVVETKSTTVGENVDREVLQSLPTSRDPWVILQQAAGVMVDRENIGGSESGQMAAFTSKGGGQEMWSMDGASIQDPASISSSTYFDFDAFEEMNIQSGGADVTAATAGVQINLVTRRGGNKINLGGRFYLTDQTFQDENLTDELREEGVIGTNVIRNIKDYGLNVGGPMFKDKVWWWLSYGSQDVKTNNIYGNRDDTLLTNYAAKLNFQLLPENRFEAFTHIGGKDKFGRSSSYSFPQGYNQFGAYYFGTPIVKFQDEHMFGDSMFVSLKYVWTGGGFNMYPAADMDLEKMFRYDVTAGIYRDSYYFYEALRPSTSIHFQGNYFNDRLFGVSHEFKFGAEYRVSKGQHQSRPPGNVYQLYNYNYGTVDITGDGYEDLVPGIRMLSTYRGWRDNNVIEEVVGFLSDTITMGKFTAILGLRFSSQSPKLEEFTMTAVEPDNPAWTDNVTPAAINAIDSIIPGLTVPTIDPDYAWNVLTPRLGLTYDMTGDGRNVFKLSLAQYGDYMGSDTAGYFRPLGLGGWMDFWWMDDGDGLADVNELYWVSAADKSPQRVFDDNGNFIGPLSGAEGIMWAGYDFNDPLAVDPNNQRYTLADDLNSSRTSEAILTFEKELMPDFGVAFDLTYRRFDKHKWNLEYDPATGTVQNQGEYVEAGTIPSEVGGYSTEDAAGRPYYLKSGDVPYRYYRYREHRPDYYQDYKGLTVRATKRMSNNWMLNASFTLQDQRQYFGDEGYLNPTNLWATDGLVRAPSIGGASGKINMDVFSSWLFKVSGLYALPLDFNVSFTMNARQGHIIPHTVEIYDYNAPNPYNRSITVYLEEYGTERLPTFYNLNFRLEKIVRAGDYGNIYFMADVFNALNSAIMNRRYTRHHGTYYPHNDSFAQNATDFLANEILNPRIVRFGIRFQF